MTRQRQGMHAGGIGPGGPAQLEGGDKGEHAGDGAVVLERDLLAEVAGGMQRAGERNVAHEGNPGGLGLFTDARRNDAFTLGDHTRRRFAGLIEQRDGELGRVDEHHGGVRDGRHHSIPAHRQLARAALLLDERVTLGVFVFVGDLLFRHLGLLLVLFTDDQNVEGGEHESRGDGGDEEGDGSGCRGLEHRRERQTTARHQYGHQRLDHQVENDADHDRFEEGLRALPERLQSESAGEGGGGVELFELHHLGAEVHSALQHTAGENRHGDRREHATHGGEHGAHSGEECFDRGLRGRVERDRVRDKHLVGGGLRSLGDGDGDEGGGGSDAEPGGDVLRLLEFALGVHLLHPFVGGRLGLLLCVRHVLFHPQKRGDHGVGDRGDDRGEHGENKPAEGEGQEDFEWEPEGERVEGRGDAAEEAETGVGEEQDDEEGSGDLHGGEEHLRDCGDDEVGGHRHVDASAEWDGVEGAEEAAEDELVRARRQQQGDRGHVEEAAELGAVDHGAGVIRLGELESPEAVDEVTGGLDSGEGDIHEEAQEHPDQQFHHQCAKKLGIGARDIVGDHLRRDRDPEADREHRFDATGEGAVGERWGDDHKGGHPHTREENGFEPAHVEDDVHVS